MLSRIEYATRQALAARRNAAEALDNRIRQDWELVAGMWEDLVRELQELRQAKAEPAAEA